MRPNLPLIASVVVSCFASSASAQVLQAPPRPNRGSFDGGPPADPNRTRQELTLTGDLLVGYDDNLGRPLANAVFASNPSGYNGFSEAMMRYSIRRGGRSVTIGGRGYMNTYRSSGISQTSYGGDQSLNAGTGLGRRTNVQFDQFVGYAPLFSLGLFGPLQEAAGVQNPDSSLTNAIAESASWTTRADARLNRQWTRKTRSTIGYSFNKQSFVGDFGFDSVRHVATLGLDQAISRAWTTRVTYSRSDGEFLPKGGRASRLRDHLGEVGLGYERRLSQTRTISFFGGVGMLYVQSVDAITGAPIGLSAPSRSGSVRFDFLRSWNIAGNYNRLVSVPQGVSAQAYVSDIVTLSSGGFVRRWLDSVFAASYSHGAAGFATSQEAGRYDSYTGTVQLRFRLSRFWSALVSGHHYQYRLNETASQLLLVPPRTNRNSLRVGVTWSLPLLGSYVDAPFDGGRN